MSNAAYFMLVICALCLFATIIYGVHLWHRTDRRRNQSYADFKRKYGFPTSAYYETTGTDYIVEERMRQIAKGFSPAHDLQHTPEVLASAAAAHVVAVVCASGSMVQISESSKWWPFSKTGPMKRYDTIGHLKVAGAFIAAALDRELAARKANVTLNALTTKYREEATTADPLTDVELEPVVTALSVLHAMPDIGERSTCVNCGLNRACPHAFDDYNLDGDCLAEK